MLGPTENPPTPRRFVTPPTAVMLSRWDITAGYTVLRIILGINLQCMGLRACWQVPARLQWI